MTMKLFLVFATTAVAIVFLTQVKFASSAVTCVREITQDYDCRCHDVCETCYTCGCESHWPWESCTHGSCSSSSCWCRGACKCCRKHECRRPCNCRQVCSTCTRRVCAAETVYNVTDVFPREGSKDAGFAVLVTGRGFVLGVGTEAPQCRFVAANGSVVETKYAVRLGNETLRCQAPEVRQPVRVLVQVSMDAGKTWTREELWLDLLECVDGDCAGHGGVPCPGQPACTGHGECHRRNETSECICSDGYYGLACNMSCPQLCSGSGVCIDGECLCARHRWGTACEKLCPGAPSNVCSRRGVCNQHTGTCVCHHGFFGADCENACVCVNGTCVGNDGSCQCDDGFSGPDCSERVCPENCYGHGDCVDGRCECYQHWVGEQCSVPNTTDPVNQEVNATVHGRVEMFPAEVEIVEDASETWLFFNRTLGRSGPVSCHIESDDARVLAGDEYVDLSASDVYWEDGDGAYKVVIVEIIEGDQEVHGDRHFTVSLVNCTGGAEVGQQRSTVFVVKGGSGGGDSEGETVSVDLQLLMPMPETDKESAQMQKDFVADVASALEEKQSRFKVTALIATNPNVVILFDVLPVQGGRPSREVAQQLLDMTANGDARLLQGKVTQHIDIAYQPHVTVRDGASVDGGDKESNEDGWLVLAIVLGALAAVVLVCVACAYRKRKPLTDWLLYKLGNFRFTRMLEEPAPAAEIELELDLDDSETEDLVWDGGRAGGGGGGGGGSGGGGSGYDVVGS